MNYKQLNNLLEQGLAVEFKNFNFYIIIGGRGKDDDENWKDSGWWCSKEECLETIGKDNGYTQEELEGHLLILKHTNTYKKINGEWKPLEDDKKQGKNYNFKHIFLCTTKQDWIDICQWLEDNTDLRWPNCNNPTEFERWNNHKEKSAINVDTEIACGYEKWYRENYPDYKFITVREFLDGKEEIPRFEGLYNMPVFSEENLKKALELINKPKKSIMSIVKRAFTSKETKAFDYFDLGEPNALNSSGQSEFIDWMYETGKTDKKEFIKFIVEKYKEEK